MYSVVKVHIAVSVRGKFAYEQNTRRFFNANAAEKKLHSTLRAKSIVMRLFAHPCDRHFKLTYTLSHFSVSRINSFRRGTHVHKAREVTSYGFVTVSSVLQRNLEGKFRI